MANRKFLYGFGIGVLADKLYKANKGKIRTAFIRVVQSALTLTNDTKGIILEDSNRKNANISKANVLTSEIQLLNQQLAKLQRQINDLEKL